MPAIKQTDGAKAAFLEGLVRTVSKQMYGKGPREVRCVSQGNLFVIRCAGVLSPLESRLVSQGGDGVDTMERVRRKVFPQERELLARELRAIDVQVEAVLHELCHDKDERILVIVTRE